jgi:hypothetical protein
MRGGAVRKNAIHLTVAASRLLREREVAVEGGTFDDDLGDPGRVVGGAEGLLDALEDESVRAAPVVSPPGATRVDGTRTPSR